MKKLLIMTQTIEDDYLVQGFFVLITDDISLQFQTISIMQKLLELLIGAHNKSMQLNIVEEPTDQNL